MFLLALLACNGVDKPDTDASTEADADTDSDTDTPTDEYGPDNAWYHAPDASLVPDEPTTDQWRRGELVPNLEFTDQNGDPVWLYQFHGKTLYIDWIAEWCGPCATFAPYLENFYAEYGDDAIVLTVMLEDSSFNRGDAAAVERWVAEYGSTNPVLWLSEDQYDRAMDLDGYPSIALVDPGLRLGQRSVNSLHDDAWIEQVVDRMIFAIGGSTDNDAEVCGNGYDDDLDLVADCMDDACADDPACPDTEVTGSFSPCTPDPDDEDTVVDIWQVVVVGAVAEIEADGLSGDTSFDNVLRMKADTEDWSTNRVVGDDEWGCTFPLAHYGCARGWIRPGTWQLMVRAGSDYSGDCENPDLAEYRLTAQGDVTLELVQDDVRVGDLEGWN